MNQLLNQSLRNEIDARWNSRTKPLGSLGRLEELARDFCLVRGEVLPACERLGVYVFAGDHGITEEGVSLYPKAVTAQMVANFRAGGAAVNVLARSHGMSLEIIDAGVGEGTKNFARFEAMTVDECNAQIEAGREAARGAEGRFDLVGLGEMGIGNTTSAAAMLAAIEGLSGREVAGRGAGLDDAGVAHKAQVIEASLALHGLDGLQDASAVRVLQCVGGFEIARMAGFVMEASRLRLPVMLDGFITTVAALAAVRMQPSTREALFFSHRSAERAHGLALEALDGDPLLELGMRLGEGSGAILGMQLMRTAMSLYREMASFESAEVSGSGQ